MKSIFKKIGIATVALAAVIGFSACNDDKTTKQKSTTNVTTKTTKKATSSKMTSTSPSTNKCSISLGNLPTGLTVKAKINGQDVDTTKTYNKGSKIDFEIENKISKFYRVTIKQDNKKYVAKWLNFCYDATDPEDVVHETLDDVELIGNLTVEAAEVDGDDVQPITFSLDEANDTQEVQNSVYVYEPDTCGRAYENGDELIEGQKIKVVLKNYASDITIKILKGEELVKLQKYDKLNANQEAYEVATIDVTKDCGVIYIETSCDHAASVMDARVNGYVINDDGVSYKLYQDDVEIQNESEITLNSEIKCTLTNKSATEPIMLTSYYAGGYNYESVKLEGGETKTLTKTATDSVMFFYEDYQEYTIAHNTLPTGVTATIKANGTEIANNTTKMKYSKINLSLTNESGKKYLVLLKMVDTLFNTTYLDETYQLSAGGSFEYNGNIYLEYDLDIIVIEAADYTYTVNNPYGDDVELSASIIGESSIESGATISYGQKINFAVFPPQNGTYTIQVTIGGVSVLNTTIPSAGYYEMISYDVTGNVVVTITKQ